MSTESDFITSQLPTVETQISQLKIMQLAWSAGGDTFKVQLEEVTKKLGAWLAVEHNLQEQLTKISHGLRMELE